VLFVEKVKERRAEGGEEVNKETQRENGEEITDEITSICLISRRNDCKETKKQKRKEITG
jgi:hypothetical protein